MNTSAIITMVVIQAIVAIITVRVYYMVMRPPKGKKDKE